MDISRAYGRSSHVGSAIKLAPQSHDEISQLSRLLFSTVVAVSVGRTYTSGSSTVTDRNDYGENLSRKQAK